MPIRHRANLSRPNEVKRCPPDLEGKLRTPACRKELQESKQGPNKPGPPGPYNPTPPGPPKPPKPPVPPTPIPNPPVPPYVPPVPSGGGGGNLGAEIGLPFAAAAAGAFGAYRYKRALDKVRANRELRSRQTERSLRDTYDRAARVEEEQAGSRSQRTRELRNARRARSVRPNTQGTPDDEEPRRPSRPSARRLQRQGRTEDDRGRPRPTTEEPDETDPDVEAPEERPQIRARRPSARRLQRQGRTEDDRGRYRPQERPVEEQAEAEEAEAPEAPTEVEAEEWRPISLEEPDNPAVQQSFRRNLMNRMRNALRSAPAEDPDAQGTQLEDLSNEASTAEATEATEESAEAADQAATDTAQTAEDTAQTAEDAAQDAADADDAAGFEELRPATYDEATEFAEQEGGAADEAAEGQADAWEGQQAEEQGLGEEAEGGDAAVEGEAEVDASAEALTGAEAEGAFEGVGEDSALLDVADVGVDATALTLEETAGEAELAGGGPENPIGDVVSGTLAIAGAAVAIGMWFSQMFKAKPKPWGGVKSAVRIHSTNYDNMIDNLDSEMKKKGKSAKEVKAIKDYKFNLEQAHYGGRDIVSYTNSKGKQAIAVQMSKTTLSNAVQAYQINPDIYKGWSKTKLEIMGLNPHMAEGAAGATKGPDGKYYPNDFSKESAESYFSRTYKGNQPWKTTWPSMSSFQSLGSKPHEEQAMAESQYQSQMNQSIKSASSPAVKKYLQYELDDWKYKHGLLSTKPTPVAAPHTAAGKAAIAAAASKLKTAQDKTKAAQAALAADQAKLALAQSALSGGTADATKVQNALTQAQQAAAAANVNATNYDQNLKNNLVEAYQSQYRNELVNSIESNTEFKPTGMINPNALYQQFMIQDKGSGITAPKSRAAPTGIEYVNGVPQVLKSSMGQLANNAGPGINSATTGAVKNSKVVQPATNKPPAAAKSTGSATTGAGA